ncbi:hypothetical protein [Ancylobacter pratisalsi]|uniref:MxaK protein n=1 Tax=Ancylobacter pratisalsi TaxID=1745854 RepID=A0A6P1YRX9_9HYPH|nr:hypothetical protein [Ancylobacter pratisalsi]QIB35765.1 hypothetical protein G3A50_20170 [Ancylobacter pratisalsi]
MSGFRQWLRQIFPAACLTALVVALLLAGWQGTRAALDHRTNAAIAQLVAGRDVPVNDNAPGALQLARLHFLTIRDRLDEAQPIANRLAIGDDAQLAVAALIDLANARLRAALDELASNNIDPAIPLVRLAKEGYRRALAIDPGLWDAKYNLDITMRLVRDFPQIEVSGEELPPEVTKRLWTDLPGLPRGLP